jgi:uncharacterized protein (TIRG00374 family)
VRWRRPALLPLLGATLAAVSLWLAFRGLETARLEALVAAHGVLLAVVLLPSLAAACLDTLAWRSLLRSVGQQVGFLPLLSSRAIAEAVLMSVPSGSLVSDGLMPRLLRERCGIPTPEGAASVVGRKAAQGVAHLTFLGLGTLALVATESAGRSAALLWGVTAASAALAAGIFAGVGVLSRDRPLQRGQARLGRIWPRLAAWLRRHEAWLQSLDGHLSLTLGRGALATASVFLLGAWLVEAFESLLILRLLGGSLGYMRVMPTEAVLSLLRTLVFFLPAGLGVQDLGYVAAFGVLGVPDAAATGAAFALLKRCRELVWIVAGYSLLWLPRPVAGEATA